MTYPLHGLHPFLLILAINCRSLLPAVSADRSGLDASTFQHHFLPSAMKFASFPECKSHLGNKLNPIKPNLSNSGKYNSHSCACLCFVFGSWQRRQGHYSPRAYLTHMEMFDSWFQVKDTLQNQLSLSLCL